MNAKRFLSLSIGDHASNTQFQYSGPAETPQEATASRIGLTTMAALLGGWPLALGTGTGAELRRRLGITIVGGLMVSQLLTLYTTPVVYLYLDRLRLLSQRTRVGLRRRLPFPSAQPNH